MPFRDAIDQSLEGSFEASFLAQLDIGAVHLFHADQRLDIQHRCDQSLHMADAPAMDQVFQLIQGVMNGN